MVSQQHIKAHNSKVESNTFLMHYENRFQLITMLEIQVCCECLFHSEGMRMHLNGFDADQYYLFIIALHLDKNPGIIRIQLSVLYKKQYKISNK